MATKPVVRVYQEDWWPFQNLPKALRAFTEKTGIATELSWDKVGVGSIETMFEHMVHSFTDDDPPYDLICTDEVMLRRFAVDGRVMPMNDRMARDGITLDDVTRGDAPRRHGRRHGDRPSLHQCRQPAPLPSRPARALRAAGAAELGRGEVRRPRLQSAVRKDGDAEFYAFATRGAGGGGHACGRWAASSAPMAAAGSADGAVTAETHAAAALAAYLDLLASVAPPDQARSASSSCSATTARAGSG